MLRPAGYVTAIVVLLAACADNAAVEPDSDAGARDGGASDSGDATTDAECYSASGAPGQCVTVSACAALGSHTSTPGRCPGAGDVQCCTRTPNTADNPPTPDGYRLMAQSQVTADMTAWAVAILRDPVTYPMFATTTRTFGALTVLARVEWHPPDFQNSVIHRGVTLYVPR
jgi:hypothetical protein